VSKLHHLSAAVLALSASAAVMGAATASVLPKGIYSSSAKQSCTGEGAIGWRVCKANFAVVPVGQVLTVTAATCNANTRPADRLADFFLDAAPASGSRALVVDFPAIHLHPVQLVNPTFQTFNASLVGQAYFPGGVMPTATVAFLGQSGALPAVNLECTMQGRLAPAG
jgi:hypothetical protein